MARGPGHQTASRMRTNYHIPQEHKAPLPSAGEFNPQRRTPQPQEGESGTKPAYLSLKRAEGTDAVAESRTDEQQCGEQPKAQQQFRGMRVVTSPKSRRSPGRRRAEDVDRSRAAGSM